MQPLKTLALAAILAGSFISISAPSQADAGYRSYYSSWNRHHTRGYFYTTYYYRPVATFTRYHHHYCIYYPSQPRYVYFYNPVRRVFWGRYDLEGKPGQEYSMLAPADQKSELTDIPESAFPSPGALPAIPDADDDARIERPAAPALK